MNQPVRHLSPTNLASKHNLKAILYSDDKASSNLECNQKHAIPVPRGIKNLSASRSVPEICSVSMQTHKSAFPSLPLIHLCIPLIREMVQGRSRCCRSLLRKSISRHNPLQAGPGKACSETLMAHHRLLHLLLRNILPILLHRSRSGSGQARSQLQVHQLLRKQHQANRRRGLILHHSLIRSQKSLGH